LNLIHSLSVGNKVKASNQIYIENKVFKKLGVAAVETIEKNGRRN
jgi:hypothetical protein